VKIVAAALVRSLIYREALVSRDFRQSSWDEATEEDCRQLVRLAVREDLERQQDWTTLALVPADRQGAADIVARQAGVIAGVRALPVIVDETASQLVLTAYVEDGQSVEAGTCLARIAGNVRDLLTTERILLNFLGRLTGIATLASEYVRLVQGTGARIYDTRKTTPGWRRLEKYAVHCGGGCNHRTGLYDAILIKDNHLAQFAGPGQPRDEAARDAVRRARKFLAELPAELLGSGDMPIEIEVDHFDQLRAVLPEYPDIVLLDNMTVDELSRAVALRNEVAPNVELEASGGVRLETVQAIAHAGVDRVSVGALTHAARSLDVGLDWHEH
jgi:nicotinate-nucleotide pyrophosphorylase (carboxylating)